MRSRLKDVVERVRSAGAPRAIASLGERNATLVLAYHNVVPSPRRAGGDASLHLSFDAFRRQLDQLQRVAAVVSVDEILRADDDRSSGRPRVAITFDDAYADAIRHAVPELHARGLPVTVFVAPALLGESGTWWDQYLGGIPEAEADQRRTAALRRLAGDGDVIVTHAAQQGWRAHATAPIASEQELSDAATLAGVTFGAHTMRHPNLAALEQSAVEHELATSMSWLRSRFAVFRPWIAYPYGLSSPQVESVAQALGYEAGFLVEGGWVTGPVPPLAWPRLNIPAGVSDRGFLSRLANR